MQFRVFVRAGLQTGLGRAGVVTHSSRQRTGFEQHLNPAVQGMRIVGGSGVVGRSEGGNAILPFRGLWCKPCGDRDRNLILVRDWARGMGALLARRGRGRGAAGDRPVRRVGVRVAPGSRIWQCGQYSGPASKLFRHNGQLIVGTHREYQKIATAHFTEYFVNAPPAWVSEFGPSAA